MYHEFTPCAALVPFIDKFWVFKGFTDIGTRFKILADGCTDFIFSIANTRRYLTSGCHNHRI